ncbi:uncharacterized protein FOMMEDRAFT_115831 [Fomitiporia mediterranea MF3/22]|uniref:uncharacterized protein n=1 Tax=Fomitiporia mediterranea (strain MF3/22) TaxID=694068 RepID=UPI0004408D09|nr:uncharacterized protein FOMMEDRAFT_115831 [Fomitiporia mediterranea MF3/22]EJD07530.1 hypothetical protein FOMMEDRAFT_115831 [Fomitiporia mediterranea MF3/22]
MAFPVPNHLPRKTLRTDVSSNILSTISDTNSKSLNAELAAGWVSELQLAIQQTKDGICDRINEQLPEFNRQLDSSRSVQIRLGDLTRSVDKLSESLERPEDGTLSTLLRTLRNHKDLAQHASDALVIYKALSYLSQCRTGFESLRASVASGKLPEAVQISENVSKALDSAPKPLANAAVMTDMKNQLRTLRDSIEEQLTEAYARSVKVSTTELRICPSVKVRQSQAIITLRDILSSLTSNSLESLLASLRRDIIAHFINFPLQQPISSSISNARDVDGTPSISLSIFPLPPSPGCRSSTPSYLEELLKFLRENLFPAVPPLASSFSHSFYKPTSSALLRDVLIPFIPASLSDLPQFLSLVRDCVYLERDYFINGDAIASPLDSEGELRTWAKGIAGHYGRKRRVDLLAQARKIVLSNGDERVVRVEVSQPLEGSVVLPGPEVIPVQGDINTKDEAENGWDFEDEVPAADSAPSTNGKSHAEEGGPSGEVPAEAEGNGWDFDDAGKDTSNQTKAEIQDDSDAWGWGDEGEDSTLATGTEDSGDKTVQTTNGHSRSTHQEDSDSSAWDSAWDEADPVPQLPSSTAQPVKAPKVAKRLEKLTAKGKGKTTASPALSSNPPSSVFSASSTLPPSVSSTSHTFSSPHSSSSFSAVASPIQSNHPPPLSSHSAASRSPALSLPQKPKEPETYLISGRIQDLVQLISEILDEGGTTASSSLFSDFPLSSPESNSSASTFVLQTAPAVLDLYRAVYPIAFAAELTSSARALRFANDCTYLHEEAAQLKLAADNADVVHEQMREALDRLHALGAWWYDEGIERECERVLQILARAEGFADTGDQERFDECEAVMSEVLREVRTSTAEWKTVLPRTRWLRAAGRIVETVLSRVLEDILALPDIPELDSRRLGELCRILNSLEAIFVDADDLNAPSMILDYVPSWLKYSYLAELLEASLADLSYLFDEGALIDFSVDELVRLVRALFADTPLRDNAIAKLQRGHPVVDS